MVVFHVSTFILLLHYVGALQKLYKKFLQSSTISVKVFENYERRILMANSTNGLSQT